MTATQTLPRYLVFVFDFYDGLGGMASAKLKTTDLEEAKAFARNALKAKAKFEVVELWDLLEDAEINFD